MNQSSLIRALALLACLCPAKADPAAETVDSGPALKAMRAEITAKPSRVLIAVEDALTMNEQAACEIVKEAIESTRADAKLVGEIVFTAISHSPAMSAVIVECAVATSPGAVTEIKKAMERALGSKMDSAGASLTDGSGKTPAEEASGEETTGTGKELTGKGVVVPPPPPAIEEDFDLTSVGVGGIYLMVPGRSNFRCHPGRPCCTGELTTACLQP